MHKKKKKKEEKRISVYLDQQNEISNETNSCKKKIKALPFLHKCENIQEITRRIGFVHSTLRKN